MFSLCVSEADVYPASRVHNAGEFLCSRPIPPEAGRQFLNTLPDHDRSAQEVMESAHGR
jgi:hypothetical protein